MKSGFVYGLLAISLAACAPAQPVLGPTPAPAPAPASPGPVPAVTPQEALDEAPENWHFLSGRIPGIDAERSYRELLAGKQPRRTVVVAVLDSGIDIEHEDLDGNIWVNEDEVPANGRDDDGNGYVDDIHGWNFIGGPGGKHVNQDTYEVTRLYASGRARFANVRADTLSAAARADYEEFQRVQKAFQEKRAAETAQLQQIRQIEAAVDRMVQLLTAHLGTQDLTRERVAAISTTDPNLRQARQIFLSLDEQGFTPEMVREQRESLEMRVTYSLDPDFDPRPIVGDNYADVDERVYGNNDVEGPDPEHGTHVAGIIAAERGNGIGVDGIAPAVKIMVLRTVPNGDERDKDVANAIRYAADNGAHIVNMSFGKSYSPGKDVVDEAVRYAEAKGVLLVHAAGNDAADLAVEPSFPVRSYRSGGMASSWIEVGASGWKQPDGLVAVFSNYGAREVDVFAPGVDIYSTVPGNEYERNSGTSMAAPVVSGLAALIMAYYPDLDAGEVRQVILESATRLTDTRVVRPGSEDQRVAFGTLSATGGIVNAYEALRLAEQRAR